MLAMFNADLLLVVVIVGGVGMALAWAFW